MASLLEPGKELLILLELAHHLGQLRSRLGRLGIERLLADDGGVRERAGEVPVALFHLAELVKHGAPSWEAGQTAASPRIGTET